MLPPSPSDEKRDALVEIFGIDIGTEIFSSCKIAWRLHVHDQVALSGHGSGRVRVSSCQKNVHVHFDGDDAEVVFGFTAGLGTPEWSSLNGVSVRIGAVTWTQDMALVLGHEETRMAMAGVCLGKPYVCIPARTFPYAAEAGCKRCYWGGDVLASPLTLVAALQYLYPDPDP